MRPTRCLLIASAAAGALVLAACGDKTAEAPPPAPTEAAGPVTPEEPVTPEAAVQAAAAADQAASSAGRDTSYSFDEGGETIEAVQAPGAGLRLSEGGRRYFYRPGERWPYLIRDGDYAYAYRDGQLTGIMDRTGRRLDDRAAEGRRDRAREWLSRGETLRRRADDRATPRAREQEQRDRDRREDWRDRDGRDGRDRDRGETPSRTDPQAPPKTDTPPPKSGDRPDRPRGDRDRDRDRTDDPRPSTGGVDPSRPDRDGRTRDPSNTDAETANCEAAQRAQGKSERQARQACRLDVRR